MRMPAKSQLVAVAAVALTLLPGGSAYAGSWTHDDARHDVVGERTSGEDQGEQFAAPDDDETDIERFDIRHDAQRVQFRVRVHRLRPQQPLLLFVTMRTSTSDDPVLVTLGRGSGGTSLALTVPDESGSIDSHPITCPRARARLSAAHDRINIAIPRRCLDHPRFVRANAYLNTGSLGGFPAPDDPRVIYQDTAVNPRSAGAAERLSPRVRAARG